MGEKTAINYRTLAGFMLPKDILRFFDVTGIEEEHTGRCDPAGEEEAIIRISLDEADSRSTLGHSLRPNGLPRAAMWQTSRREDTRSSCVSEGAGGLTLRGTTWC